MRAPWNGLDFSRADISVVLIVGVMLLWMENISAAELVLNNVNGPPFTTPQHDGFLDRIGSMAFGKAGVQLRLIDLPAERGLVNANAGIDDGDLTRIAGLEAVYPNLVRVPEKLLDWNFSAFSRKANFKVDGWGSLLPYRVGFIRGWKIAEANVGAAASVVMVDDERELFDLLRKDRVDIVIYTREMGASYLRLNKIDNVKLLEPPIAVREVFIYLNRKHIDLVPRLASALRDLKADGTYDREYRAAVSLAVRSATP